MSIAEAEVHLRSRFFVCKGLRSIATIAEEVGVHRNTLLNWLNGESVGFATLLKVEAWCATQQQAIFQRLTR